jgi:hypothetical protein
MMQRVFGSNRCVLFLVLIHNDDPHSSHAERERERERERARVDGFGVRDAQALSDEKISRTFLQEKSLKY